MPRSRTPVPGDAACARARARSRAERVVRSAARSGRRRRRGAPVVGARRARALRPGPRPRLAPHLVQRAHRAAHDAARRRPASRRRRAPTTSRRPGRSPPVAPDDGDRGALGATSPSPMAALPGGAAFGTLVHARARRRPTSPHRTSRRAARAALDERVGRDAAIAGLERDLADALLPALDTPLGPLAGGPARCATSPAPTGSTSSTSSCRSPAATGRPAQLTSSARSPRCCAAHLPADDRSRPTPTARRPGAAATRLRGYLTGSIDAVLARCRHVPRYVVVDYKTNWLGGADEPLTAWHYRPAALAAAMQRRALPAAGAALLRRAAPLPALAAARLRPRRAPRRRAVPVPARHGGPDTPRVDGSRAACSPGGRRPASSWR